MTREQPQSRLQSHKRSARPLNQSCHVHHVPVPLLSRELKVKFHGEQCGRAVKSEVKLSVMRSAIIWWGTDAHAMLILNHKSGERTTEF